MKSVSKQVTNILLVVAVCAFLFSAGYRLGEYKTKQGFSLLPSVSTTSTSSQPKSVDLTLFWNVWSTLEEKYIDKKKIDPKKMFFGAIKGMVASVEDPYTFFLTPEENKQSKEDLEGKFEGIGAQLGLKEGRIVIVAPLKNSPAEKAGALAGDVIVKVDKLDTKGWSLPQAVSKIRGTKGTPVVIGVDRSGKELSFKIVRDVINVESVEVTIGIEASTAQKEAGHASYSNVAYIKLNQFGTNTNDEWDMAVEKIAEAWKSGKIQALVLDVRDNPGGYLESSVYLASEFLPKDSLVVKQESSSKAIETKEYRVARTGKLLDIPLVVLINRGSASASEILSGALRDWGRAVLVGEKSFGKGSVQEALNLKDDAGLHVTVAKWLLPKGEWINGKGIEPKFAVTNTVPEGNTMMRDYDAQLDRAIQEIAP